MGTLVFELVIVILLILLNGGLAMAEIAVVSARKTRLQQQAEAGIAGAQAALNLANEPGQLLSTVQIGITLIGILAGAFGGATLAEEIEVLIRGIGPLQKYAQSLSVGVVVLFTTYLSLVVGELAPKQIGLANPERIAAAMSPGLVRLSRFASPAVAFLGVSTRLLLRLLRFRPQSEPAITEEEIKIVIEQGAETGVLEPIEEEIVDQVFRLSDRKIGSLITPRTEITWIDLDDPIAEIMEIVAAGEFSQFPVAHGSLDNVTGIVRTNDLLKQCLAGEALDLHVAQHPALFLPEGMPVYTAIEQFRQRQVQIALVIDEYGGVQGLVTINDVLEALVGQFPDLAAAADPDIVLRDDGSWLLDGMLGLDRLKDLLDIDEFPEEDENLYQTLGGLVMTVLGRIPTAGDAFDWAGMRFEVMDMDGRRVDKVLVREVRDPAGG